MRLLHAKTQTLHEFYEDDIPSYAILSHTWSEGEVTFRDIEQSPSPDSYSEKAGWVKIRNCCLQALKDGLEYVWVDTCCIDKSSSAELQEAINSMFGWYEMSQVCYAYLVDVRAEDDPKAVESSFRRSNWFKRGWTLQELIAPVLVRFVDISWNPIGTRYGLRETISDITGIKQTVLVGAAFGARQAMRAASVAQKMSWAAFRSTSRVEDMAYSLLGIFEINMPLIYGEGEKAFQRLQEEIIKISDDQTILAWGFKQAMPGLWGTSSALARSPSDFGACSELEFYGTADPSRYFKMSQRGLQLHLPTTADKVDASIVYCLLNCGIPNSATRTFPCLAVPLLRNQSRDFPHGQSDKIIEYSRMSLKTPLWVSTLSDGTQLQREPLYLPRLRTREASSRWRIDVKIENADSLPKGLSIIGIYPPALTADDLIILSKDFGNTQVLIHFLGNPHKPSLLVIMRCQTEVTYLSRHFGTLDIELLQTFNDIKNHAKDLIQQLIRELFNEVFNLSRLEGVEDTMSLAELGVDSLTSMHIVLYLRNQTGLPLDLDTFVECHTLRDIERKLVVLLNSQILVEEVMGTKGFEDMPRWRRWRDPAVTLSNSVQFGIKEIPHGVSLLDILSHPGSWDQLDWHDAIMPDDLENQGIAVPHWEARLPFGADEELLISYPDPLKRFPDPLQRKLYDLRFDMVPKRPGSRSF